LSHVARSGLIQNAQRRCLAARPEESRHAPSHAGAVIAYPTEAVFGLGCDPLDAAAVDRLLTIKQRDITKGLILIAADFDALVPFVEPLDDTRMAAIQATWPGPNTWLMPARPRLRPGSPVHMTASPFVLLPIPWRQRSAVPMRG
jgi:tRNA A37 threonylcarbamoyladenosine synthetase subunit TsaC/SUA5/YrdC